MSIDYKMIIAIDPGKGGGIAHIKLNENGKADGLPSVVKMPDEHKIDAYIKTLKEEAGLNKIICFIEKLSIRPDDMQGGKAFRVQKMMKNYNFLLASMIANGIGTIEVHPRTWQSALKLVLPKEQRKKESKTERKNRYKDIAQCTFPFMKCTLWNCDALLIMQFGWQKVTMDKQYIYKNLPDNDLDLLF